MANCLCEVYQTEAAFHTAVELVDDGKFLCAFPFRAVGAGKDVIILVKKT